VRLLLEAYYEPQFSEHSHGYRPGRGCHTALGEVARTWTGTTWFIEGDISRCFDQLDHEVMLETLGEKIHDNRLLRLIGQMLRAGYLEDWVWRATLSGAPQGGVLSPCLSNIYLNRLDTFVETTLMPEYTRGARRKRNPEHGRITAAIGRARKRGDHAAVRALRKQQRRLPGLDPNDPEYRRLRYVRYADDILLGFAGPRSEAEEIKRRLGQFLHEELALELSETKTLITHARTSAARFLGYEITIQHNDRKITAGHRSVNGGIRLSVPREVIATKFARYMQRGKPAQRPELMNEQTHAIISQYGAEYRGIVQYYLLAGDVYRLDRLRWVMLTSLQDAGPQARLDGDEDRPQVRGHDPDAARAAQMHASRRRSRRRKTAIGRHVRWHSTQAAADRDPSGTRSRPSELPPQRADPQVLGGTVRDLRRTGKGARAPNPQARRPRQARTAAARMGADHGQAPSQDPRGLRTLLRQHPPQKGPRVNHGTVAGEPGELKGSRRVVCPANDYVEWVLEGPRFACSVRFGAVIRST